MDLHSSMDRFEELSEDMIASLYKNLHSSMDRFEEKEKTLQEKKRKIYIPVWIDLKFIKHLCFLHPLPYLHSSMDRFEEAIAKNMDNEEFNLHSSMDRFEVK